MDNNVGKLAKWLRMMGYDTLFFNGSNDSRMIAIALAEGRVVLTKDTQIMKRGVITKGQLKAILPQSDEPELQMCQIIDSLNLDCQFKPFSICLECNQPLEEKSKEQVKDLVPPPWLQPESVCWRCQPLYRLLRFVLPGI